VEEEGTSESKVYRVFGIPAEIYRSEEVLPHDLRERVSLFTVAQFSPAGTSLAVNPDLRIFHIFMDDEKLLMTVSEGEEVLYSRSLSVPSYISEVGNVSDFLYENTNMTYVFVAQRQGLKIDLILVSGKAKDDEQFLQSLMELSPVGIATPLPPPSVRNLSPDIFHRHMPEFGSLFLSERHDFTPLDIKEKRKFMKISYAFSKALALVLAAMLFLLALRGFGVLNNLGEIKHLKNVVALELENITRDPFVSGGNFDYFRSYLSTLSEVRIQNPINILPEATPLPPP
jgi:hypothetical protein